MLRAIACKTAYPLLRCGRQNWVIKTRNFATRAPPGRRSTARNLLLFGGASFVGAEVALLVKSCNDSDFKKWIDGYIPGWALIVDKICQNGKPFVEWFAQKRKDLFTTSEQSDKPTKPLSADKSMHDVADKRKSPEISTPLEGHEDKDESDSVPILKVTADTETPTVSTPLESSDISKKSAEVIVSEEVAQAEQKKVDEPKEMVEELSNKSVDAKPEDSDGGRASIESQQETVLENANSSLSKYLEEYADACGTVIVSNLALVETLQKARNDIAVMLLQPSPDYDKLAELEKSAEVTASSLKDKIEDSYSVSCDSYQLLLVAIENATEAGLSSEVSQALKKVFELTAILQSSEDELRKAKLIGSAFTNFRATLKLTDSELEKELDKAVDYKPLEVSEEEAALLLLAERQLKLLCDKLKQLSPAEIANSLEQHKVELAKIYEDKLQKAMDESRADIQEKTEAKLEDARRKYHIELLEQLRRQAITHNQHLKDCLEQKEMELHEKWSEELRKKLAVLAEQHRLEIVEMYGKLAGIESTIDIAAKASHEVRLRQSLHTASDNLFKALVLANQCLEAEKQCTFDKEIARVREVAGHDEMIDQLLLSIPEEAIKEGMYSEEVLKERFYRVKRICSRVSLVPLEGAGIGTYAVSYLRSLLMLTVRNIPLDSDPSELDTFQLLQLASTHLSAGDLEMAARIMNQLRGEPGRVAKDWISDVRVYLQTKQAITTLADYMCAAGISLLK